MADNATAAVVANPTAPAAPVSGTPAAPVAAAADSTATTTEQKFKVKVDGKEEEVPLAELQKHYGTFKASQKAMQESAEVRKQAEEALTHIKSGTRDALRNAGLSDQQIRAIAIDVLAEEHKAIIEEERKKSLSAEQRELEDTRAKLKASEEEKSRLTGEKKAALVAEAKQEITGKVIDTLDRFPESVRRNEALANAVVNAWAYVLEHPEQAKELGIDPTPQGIHAALMKRQRELARELLTHAKDEELDEYIAPTVKGRLFKSGKAAAEAAAHPSLTSHPEVRSGKTGEMAPNKSRNKTIREITLGSIGLK